MGSIQVEHKKASGFSHYESLAADKKNIQEGNRNNELINYDLYNIICNDNNKRLQTFQTSWAKGRLWLVFDEDLNMFCSTC